ncbi:hypothetical protein ZIOFF_064145 [Zingiber officinale]|uniref:Uncharacterized protein n=1 Tax=Zingiber officinale TaxID=94328 RepID=A0A8J5CFF0_ZINOF|nr:hypothetical protein ZIOFF_064145 [Zingiber officinale]
MPSILPPLPCRPVPHFAASFVVILHSLVSRSIPGQVFRSSPSWPFRSIPVQASRSIPGSVSIQRIGFTRTWHSFDHPAAVFWLPLRAGQEVLCRHRKEEGAIASFGLQADVAEVACREKSPSHAPLSSPLLAEADSLPFWPSPPRELPLDVANQDASYATLALPPPHTRRCPCCPRCLADQCYTSQPPLSASSTRWKRRDISKALRPGSEAEMYKVLAFGTLFSAPYKGSELYIDIHGVQEDQKVQSLLKKFEFLPFTPEIMAVGKKFALNNIKKPFIYAQQRLLDGQFKNHWKTTFPTVRQKLKSIELKPNKKMVMIQFMFNMMTGLRTVNWTGTYLEDLAKDASYQLHKLDESSQLIVEAGKRVIASEHVTVCSCTSVGFVGTAGSTIADNIELMRMYNACKL